MSSNNNRKVIIVSGVNFFEGGPLTVMIEALTSLSNNFSKTHTIYALVSSKKDYPVANIKFIEFPKSRKSWLLRLYYEFFVFNKISKNLKPDYWLSMHDITPHVSCNKRFVYCHNPAPFFRPTIKDARYGFTTFLFSIFYKFLYRINLKKNKNIIVQQAWLREEFEDKWDLDNIIVAYPLMDNSTPAYQMSSTSSKESKSLFYPSFPRSFKNFELICKAYELLSDKKQEKLKIYMTIDGSLNAYAKAVVKKYKHLRGLNFLGLLKRDEVFEYYEKVDGLIFPSRLETWGLPITEFKNYMKPILLANLPYAHESVGNYEKAHFFDPYSPVKLASLFDDFIEDKLIFEPHNQVNVKAPFYKGWDQLFEKIFND